MYKPVRDVSGVCEILLTEQNFADTSDPDKSRNCEMYTPHSLLKETSRIDNREPGSRIPEFL